MLFIFIATNKDRMRKLLLLLFCSFFSILLTAQPLITPFERSYGEQTPTYREIIAWWKMLDQRSDRVSMSAMGATDAGLPLHLVVVSNDRDFNFTSIRRKNKRIILINNGIHPGEPDGIDASMLLVRDIVSRKINLPNNVVLAIIPVYNIGGCLNRSSYYRVDQNGPRAFGSRGNSQYLDLNRDFIKSDSKEARSFATIFHLCDPDIFIDNHVSNGADYQHIVTLLSTQHNKLGDEMGRYLHDRMEPALLQSMKEKGFDLTPYVNVHEQTPDNGWTAYFDSPRYSSGYAALWHSFSCMIETHMLKTYEQRVKGNYALLRAYIEFTSANSDSIRRLRARARQADRERTEFPVSWAPDKSKWTNILFRGFEADYRPSEVSGLPRRHYDRSKPFEKEVRFYDYYQPAATVKKPAAYIIPQGWRKVIELLKINGVSMSLLSKDTVIEVEAYHIDAYRSSPRQYEMHHPNSDVKVSSTRQSIAFRKGDYYIPMQQDANRFLVQVLEPQADDSYFSWNFFDAILGQKEGYSDYVFEDKAAQYLKAHPDLRAELDEKKASDTAFAKSASAQLDFVFRHTPYYEPDHLRYPVYRVVLKGN